MNFSRISIRLVLVTGLDTTFARGITEDALLPFRALEERSDCFLIHATRRNEESARAFQESLGLPEPDLFITDTGARVVNGRLRANLSIVQTKLCALWPGARPIRTRLERLDRFIEEQPEAPQWRLAYHIREDCPAREALRHVNRALDDLGVNVIPSNNTHIDVVPGGVDPRTTLLLALESLAINPESVVVAGASQNMLPFFREGFLGIVPLNGEPELTRMVAGRPGVYVARDTGLGGIYEGLKHWGIHLKDLRGQQRDADS